MGTYRRVFIPSKFSSVENANKKHKSSVSAREKNGVVNVCIFDGMKSLLGKLKAFVEEKKVDYHNFGDNFNGYGYQDHYHDYYLNAKDGKAFIEMLDAKKKVTKKVKAWEDVRDAWARSLVRKSENAVTFEEAQQMAEEKVDYKNDRISAMISRQCERGYSGKRGKLIAKMESENPLRPIKDYDHALNIIAASKRHNNTIYDSLLNEAHDMERYGDIEPGTAKEWVREQIMRTKQV